MAGGEVERKRGKSRITGIVYKINQSDNLKAQNTIQLVDFYLASGLTQIACFSHSSI